MLRSSHSSSSRSVDRLVGADDRRASRTFGRAALAKASARSVGLCSLETSTIACTRVGSTLSSSSAASSSATLS